MKYFITIIIAVLCATTEARSQSVAQLLEQLSLDIRKLSELRTVLNDLYTSYKVINTGYEQIKRVAEGNFNLHKTFLDGLLKVSPGVRQYYRIGLIVGAAGQIEKTIHTLKAQNGRWSPEEHASIIQVAASLAEKASREMDQLTMTTTDGALRMSDPERIRTIDEVYQTVTNILAWAKRFEYQLAIVDALRAREAVGNNLIKQLYE